MNCDTIIVGAGFAGIVMAERLASQAAREVLVIEKHPHIGGHCADSHDEHGVLIHNYGPHIFHTSKKHVWQYLSRFTEWRPYQHHVLGMIDGKLVPIPFNLNTLHELLPNSMAARIETKLIDRFGVNVKVPILQLRQADDKDLRSLADYVYEKVFLNYTLKQWNCRPEDLDPSVTARVPVYVSRDNRYFQDPYQAMPLYGYTGVFERMLAHPNIRLLLNTDYKEVVEIDGQSVRLFGRPFAGTLVYTGPIDYFFSYRHGKLPYRTLRFEFEHSRKDVFQPVAVVNYPNDYDFTRITEFKHMTGQTIPGTTVLREFSEDYDPEVEGRNTPYYIVNKPENLALYQKYRKEMDAFPNILCLGRLAEYRYYNMDEVTARALEVFHERFAAQPD